MSLSIRGLNVSLSKNHILKDINLDIKSGGFVSILGNSGCGKTTLIKSIAGLVDISSGSISIDENDISGLSPEKRKTVIVFQDLRLFPHMNVEQNIAFSMKLQKMDKKDIEERVKVLLEQVRLSGFEKRKISQLSGGQMQRVALARALGANPKLLLLDEPFSGLDESLRKDMGNLVKRLHKENKITTIMITHDKEEAMKFSDKVALMKEGTILQYSTPLDIFSRPKSKEVAQFMGELNYFDGEVKDGKFTSEIISFNTDKAEGKYSLMLRPGGLSVSSKSDEGYLIKETVYTGEFVSLLLERDKEYLVRLAYKEFKSLELKAGDYVKIKVNEEVFEPVLL
ncbi:MAG: ABC transporter ATP-binding protein [Lachnospiraceae bacterium]|nr:MAG: ABC transporter ATP-binding protein [Lachnospiraceae bacterium]